MLNLFKVSCLTVILLSTTQCSTLRWKMTSQMDDVVDNLSTIYQSPKSQVWGDFNLLEHPILFISFEKEFIYKYQNDKLQSLKFDEWKKKIEPSNVDFDFYTEEDQAYLAIFLDKTRETPVERVTETILHEGFHIFRQSQEQGWTKNQKNQSRGTIYPLQAMARYYRWEMYQSLKNYLEKGDAKYLQIYSSWFNKWKTQFPDEYDNYTDRIEGSAQFYSNELMTLLHNRTQNTQIYNTQYFIEHFLGHKKFVERFSLSFESYALGTLTAIVLQDLKVNEWKEKINKGASPLELLAEQSKPVPQRNNQKELNIFVAASIREMEAIDQNGKLDSLISQLSNPKYVRIAIDNKNVEMKSFATSGMFRPFFKFDDLKKVMMIGLLTDHQIKTASVNIMIPSGEFWVLAEDTPCFGESSTTVFFVPYKDVHYAGKNLKLESFPKVTTTATRTRKGKMSWYCLQ